MNTANDIEKIKETERVYKPSQYRLKYKNYYNIEFDDSYVIHHIDFDHNNDDIDNLLLLPKALHTQYHSLLSYIESEKDHKLRLLIGEITPNQLDALASFIKTLKQIEKWMKWKQYDYDPDMAEFIFDELE